MRKIDLLYKIAEGFTENTLPDIVEYCTEDVSYITRGCVVASNKNELYSFLKKRQTAIKKAEEKSYGFVARVEETERTDIVPGDFIVALSQVDQYNCTGYAIVSTNVFGKIKKIEFCRDSSTIFKCESDDKWSIVKVPKDAHEAIGCRAIALGIMDERVILSRHIQRYDEFHDILQDALLYIVRNLFENFNEGITNMAGYLYATAMIFAVNRQRDNQIDFTFSPEEAVNGNIPQAEGYQEWINSGYDMGKKLFVGFIEYVSLRSPDAEEFNDQITQSFMDMLLYGSIQANKDMDLGIIGNSNVNESYKGIFVMTYMKSIGFDFETIGDVVCDENRDKSYEIISQNPSIGKYEFVEKLGIEYDEEEILMHEFLCHLQMQPYRIAEAMDEDNYDKTLEIMRTQPDISREEFFAIMNFTDKYKEEFTYD